ncbi:hypothetical protein [Nonomuraea glycinis]|uniref:hypothetical protein n=1 Tax=Nonomuraea glycinis TaxID=2047744 RepID=UPI0033BC0CC8
MNRMPPPEVTIDAHGRYSSGRRFGVLAEEYGQFVAGLREHWDGECPLPYEEFAEPYSELRHGLLEDCEELGTTLLGIGEGQIVMSVRNIETEQANTLNALRLGKEWAET